MTSTMKQLNQHILRLKDQILLENKVFFDRTDAFHYGLTLLCDNIYSVDQRQENRAFVEKYFQDFRSIDVTNAHEVLLLLALSCKFGIALNRQITESATVTLLRVAEAERLPLSIKGFILYLAKQSNIQTEAVNAFETRLQEIGRQHLESNNVEYTIDAVLGTSSFLTDTEIEQFKVSAMKKAADMTREKLAKCVLILHRWKVEIPTGLIKSLEEKIEYDFSNWIVPDILFALIESEKLVNSNIPPEQLEDIFDSLKRSGSRWTQMVETVKESGIVIDLKRFVRMPALSPVDDVLSYLALKCAKREYIYQVEEADYEEYLKFNRMQKNGGFLSQPGTRLMNLFVVFECMIWVVITWFNWESSSKYYQHLLEFRLVPRTIGEFVAIIMNPIFLTGFLIRWNWNVWVGFKTTGFLSVHNIVTQIPLLRRLSFKE